MSSEPHVRHDTWRDLGFEVVGTGVDFDLFNGVKEPNIREVRDGAEVSFVCLSSDSVRVAPDSVDEVVGFRFSVPAEVALLCNAGRAVDVVDCRLNAEEDPVSLRLARGRSPSSLCDVLVSAVTVRLASLAARSCSL